MGKNHIELLEKIADHLETISWTLPQYERHLQRARMMRHGFKPERLVRLMSYVYTDIIQFIQRVNCIFSRGRKGTF